MKLLDRCGRMFRQTPNVEELRKRTISHTVRDRGSTGSILTDVTPARIVAIFREADNGLLQRQVELAEDMRERDDHVSSVDQTRRQAVASLDYVIEPGDDSRAAKFAAEAFARDWECLEPRAIYDRMMDAIVQQWHVERLLWDTDGQLNGRAHWRPIASEEEDARRLVWSQIYDPDPSDLSAIIPRMMRDWNPNDAEPVEPGKYLVHSYRAKRGRPGRGALVRAIAAYWMFKRFALIDLSTLLEQWGRPWPVIKYDPQATDEQVRGWLTALADSMADRVMAVPLGSEIEVKPASATGADAPHGTMVRLANEAISKVIVGSTTIAEAAQSNESVSSPTHAGVRLDIRNADAWSIASSIYSGVAVPYTLWNFGADVAPPKIRPNLAPKPDPEARGRVFLQAQSLALEVKSEQIYSELALDKPEQVPETIKLERGGGMTDNPLAGLFGGSYQPSSIGGQQSNKAAINRAPRGSVAPGGQSAADDPALARWSDQAAAAAGQIGDEKFARIASWIAQLERQGASLHDVQARLDELLGKIASDDEVELNHQLTLAGLLRGRYAVAEEVVSSQRSAVSKKAES